MIRAGFPWQSGPRRMWLARVGDCLGLLFCRVTEFIARDLRRFRICVPKAVRNLGTQIYQSQHAEALFDLTPSPAYPNLKLNTSSTKAERLRKQGQLRPLGLSRHPGAREPKVAAPHRFLSLLEWLQLGIYQRQACFCLIFG